MAAQSSYGRYRIIKEVGAGGLGQVFKAIDEDSGQTVAVKLLHQKFQKNKRRLGFFHRELLIAARLKHKHIVEFIDANFEPPDCYIVTEFVDGWSLYQLIKNFRIFPPLVGLCIAIDVLQGIDYLHLHDMIHSDLSSPNVMVDKTGRVLVTDFGLASQDAVEDYKNYVIGTPGYYSPEHISEASIIPQSDVYCVGLLLYEMITGTKAVEGSRNRREVMRAMKRIDFKRIRCSDRKLQSMLRRLLKKSLKVSTSRRIKSAEAMVFEVYKILRHYEVRYSRHAVLQFLMDHKLAVPASGFTPQHIYRGFEFPNLIPRTGSG